MRNKEITLKLYTLVSIIAVCSSVLGFGFYSWLPWTWAVPHEVKMTIVDDTELVIMAVEMLKKEKDLDERVLHYLEVDRKFHEKLLELFADED